MFGNAITSAAAVAARPTKSEAQARRLRKRGEASRFRRACPSTEAYPDPPLPVEPLGTTGDERGTQPSTTHLPFSFFRST